MRILSINQVAGPLFRELQEALCRARFDVTMVSGSLDAPDAYVPPFRWIHACPLEKTPAWRRIVTWGRFTLQAFLAMARHRHCFALLVSNPPLVPWIAPLAKWLFGVRYGLLIYDVYPDVLVRAGMIRQGGLIERVLQLISATALRQAERVITLSEAMAQTLAAHLPNGHAVKMHVISNWADTDAMKPIPKAENPFVAEHGLKDKLVVMYSGAFSDSHDLRSLVDAAELLKNEPDIEFVLIGEGVQKQAIAQWLAEKALDNCQLLPWQSLDQARYSLAAADCHIVSMDAGREGTICPSKIYSALAVGAAIAVISPAGTEIADIVERERCGVWVTPHRPVELADALRALLHDPLRLSECKANARSAAEREYNAQACTSQYVDVLGDCLDHCEKQER